MRKIVISYTNAHLKTAVNIAKWHIGDKFLMPKLKDENIHFPPSNSREELTDVMTSIKSFQSYLRDSNKNVWERDRLGDRDGREMWWKEGWGGEEKWYISLHG